MRLRVAARAEVAYPPLRAVESRSLPTLCRLMIDENGHVQPSQDAYHPGDGRVPWGGSRPGGGVKCPVLESNKSHAEVPVELHVVSLALLQVIDERNTLCS